MVRWESVPGGFSAHACKPDWLTLGLRGWVLLDSVQPAIFRRERSDDRKCVCCSQARFRGDLDLFFATRFSLVKGEAVDCHAWLESLRNTFRWGKCDINEIDLCIPCFFSLQKKSPVFITFGRFPVPFPHQWVRFLLKTDIFLFDHFLPTKRSTICIALGFMGLTGGKKQNRWSRHSLPVSSSELSFKIVLEFSKRVAVKGNELFPLRLLICWKSGWLKEKWPDWQATNNTFQI